MQEERHSAQCRKSSQSTSSVSDSCRVLSESAARRDEQRELELVPDLGASWGRKGGREETLNVKA